MGARDGGLRERLATRDGGGRWATVGKGGRQWGRRVGDGGARESEKRERSDFGGNWNLGLEGKKIIPPNFPRPHLSDVWSWKVPYSRPSFENVGRE